MSATVPVFPAASIPDDPALGRLLGLYPQVQEGLWLQRVKILGGILTGDQWRALAAIARRYSSTTPLHLTTRQDIEIHDLRAEHVPLVQREMDAAGLTGLGACGDTVRNVTVCPCSGLLAAAPDLDPLAWRIRRLLEAQEGVYGLPRKFKVSLSACRNACAQPFINDVGLVACQRDDRWGFRVIIAGSLGVRPNTGIELFDWLAAADALPLVLAALQVFARHGDRVNRHKARLRHVRERMGDAAFTAMMREALDQARASRPWPAIELAEPNGRFTARVNLGFLGGDVSPEAAQALGDLADDPDIRVRIANPHRVAVFGRDRESLAGRLAGHPEILAAAIPAAAIVACPGNRWCKRGLTDTLAMARRIRETLGDTIPPEAVVCISGCPNGCAHSAVADIGLTGARTTIDGAPCDAYNLLLGGGMGRDARLARLAGQKLTQQQVIDHIAGGPDPVDTASDRNG